MVLSVRVHLLARVLSGERLVQALRSHETLRAALQWVERLQLASLAQRGQVDVARVVVILDLEIGLAGARDAPGRNAVLLDHLFFRAFQSLQLLLRAQPLYIDLVEHIHSSGQPVRLSSLINLSRAEHVA